MNHLESQLAYPLGDAVPVTGALTELAPGLCWLRMPLPFALDHINLWLLQDEVEGRAGWAAVDCGVATDATRAAWEQVLTSAVKGAPLLRVFATHCHPDHIGLGGPLVTQMGERRNYYPSLVPAVPASYTRMQDRQRIRVGAREWRVITGFGHSPEHASLYCEELKVLIAGDMVLPRISTNVSVFAVEPEGNPLQLYLDSLCNYAELPADTLVLPSSALPWARRWPTCTNYGTTVSCAM